MSTVEAAAVTVTVLDELRDYGVSNAERSKIPDQWKPFRSSDVQATRIVEIESTVPWHSQAIQRLADLSNLQDNWDGGGADAPNQMSISTAHTVVKLATRFQLPKPDIDPSVENGICISFREHGKYAHVECFNDGEIVAATMTRRDDPEVWEVTRRDLQQSIARLSSYLR